MREGDVRGKPMDLHCKMLQGSHKEHNLWERLEEVLCEQQAGEGSDGGVLPRRAFPQGQLFV